MSEGNSQGLFLVVAIVIFGIFVGLTYTVFGSEGLSNDLKGLFEAGIENSSYTETINKSKNLVKEKDLMQHGGLKEENFTIDDKGTLTLESDGANYIGVRIPSTLMKKDKEYKLSFNIRKLEGIVTHIGGHMSYSTKTTIYIDGFLVSESDFKTHGYLSSWYYGLPIDNVDEEHKVEVYYNTNFYGKNEVYDTPKYQSMFIQPNRGHYSEPYKVEITNIELFEI